MTTAADALKFFANVTILYTGLALLAFIILYAGFFNWRKTAGGRSVLYFVGSLELLIFLAAFLQWLPDLLLDETEQLLRWEVYITIAAAATRMLFVLVTRWRVTGKLEIEVEPRARSAPVRAPEA